MSLLYVYCFVDVYARFFLIRKCLFWKDTFENGFYCYVYKIPVSIHVPVHVICAQILAVNFFPVRYVILVNLLPRYLFMYVYNTYCPLSLQNCYHRDLTEENFGQLFVSYPYITNWRNSSELFENPAINLSNKNFRYFSEIIFLSQEPGTYSKQVLSTF